MDTNLYTHTCMLQINGKRGSSKNPKIYKQTRSYKRASTSTSTYGFVPLHAAECPRASSKPTHDYYGRLLLYQVPDKERASTSTSTSTCTSAKIRVHARTEVVRYDNITAVDRLRTTSIHTNTAAVPHNEKEGGCDESSGSDTFRFTFTLPSCCEAHGGNRHALARGPSMLARGFGIRAPGTQL